MFHGNRPLLIAHRGFSAAAPENTLAAIEEAVRYGADVIEIDVHLSKEGIPVVIHDETLERTTRGSSVHHVSALELEEIKKHDAGTWFHPDYASSQIPTLEEVLTFLKPHSIGLMVEIKKGNSTPEKLATAVLSQIYRHRLQHPTIVGSFEPAIIKAIQDQRPDQMVIGIVEDLHALSAWDSLNVSHLALNHPIFNEALMEILQTKQKHVWSFTVDDPAIAKRLLSWGVRGIITNDPAKIKPCLF